MRVSWLLADVWRSVTRHRTGFLMTTAVQVACLTLLGIFAVAAVGLAQFTAAARRQIEIQAFLEPHADPIAVESRISRISGVAATRYVSSAEALADLQAELGVDSTILTLLETNPLPPSVRVTLSTNTAGADELADIEHKLALLPGVAEVFSGAETLARLGLILRVLTGTALAIILLSSLAVVFIAFSTVESSLRARAREIEIMELVGASRLTIRLPFIAEAGLQGLASGLLAALIVLLLVAAARTLLFAFPVPVGPVIAAGTLLGMGLGLSGSAFALGQLDR